MVYSVHVMSLNRMQAEANVPALDAGARIDVPTAVVAPELQAPTTDPARQAVTIDPTTVAR